MRPELRKKLKLLLVGSTLLVAAILSLSARHYWLIRHQLKQLRDDGFAAWRDADASKAVSLLGTYLQKRGDDADALAAFATAQEMTPLPGKEHLFRAIRARRHLRSLKPDDHCNEMALAALYQKAGLWTQSLELLNVLASVQPDDQKILELKSEAELRSGDLTAALASTERLRKIDVSNLRGHQRAYALMWRIADSGTGSGDLKDISTASRAILIDAKRLRSAHKNDPRFAVLSAYALLLVRNTAEPIDVSERPEPGAEPVTAVGLLRQAAMSNTINAEFAKALAEQFDSVGLPRDSRAYVQRLTSLPLDPATRDFVARRLWEQNSPSQVIDLLKSLDTARDSSELLALRALSLAELGNSSAAFDDLKRLEVRKDSISRAWAEVIRYSVSAKRADRHLIDIYHEALLYEPRSPLLLFFLGDAYFQWAELDLAIQSWEACSAYNASWEEPLRRLAIARMKKGNVESSLQAAQQAVKLAPDSTRAAITLIQLRCEALKLGHKDDPGKLLALIEQLQKALPGEPGLLAGEIDLLCRLDRKADARAALQHAIPSVSSLSAEAVVQLVALSETYGLGLEDDLLSRTERDQGVSPQITFQRAYRLWRAGRAEQGLALLKTGQVNATGNSKAGWQLLLARYLELTGSQEASSAWQTLGNSYPENLEIQQAVIGSSAAASQKDFMKQTIERIRDLTGEGAVAWRLAQAAWYLQFAESNSDITAAVKLLTETLTLHSNSVEAHVLLARCMERLANPRGALQHLNAAADLRPDSAVIALSRARILKGIGEDSRARAEMDRVVQLGFPDPKNRYAAALFFEEQGDSRRALDLLLSPSSNPAVQEPSLLLAQLYQRTGDLKKAEEITRILVQNTPDAPTIRFAADFFANQGRVPEGRQVLNLLDRQPLTESERLLIQAGFASRFEGHRAAADYLERAVNAEPNKSEAWKKLLLSYVGSSDVARAKELVMRASQYRPSELGFSELTHHPEWIELACSNPSAGATLAAWLDNHEAHNTTVPVLLSILSEAQLTHRGVPWILERVLPLSSRDRRLLPLQAITAELLLKQNRIQEAIGTATEAAHEMPRSAEAARLVAHVLAASRRWEDALSWARTSARLHAAPIDVSMSFAEIYLGSGKSREAIEQLKPHLALCLSAPSLYWEALELVCRAMVATEQYDQARKLTQPLLTVNVKCRVLWHDLVSSQLPEQEAVEWLNELAKLPNHGQTQQQLDVARSWSRLAARTHQSSFAARARSIFQELALARDASSDVLIAAAMQAEIDQDQAGAEKLYRRALALAPSAIAQNNLALLLMDESENATEAINFAQAACQNSPDVSAFQDTLASVLAKNGKFDASEEAQRTAVRLEPAQLRWRVALLEILLSHGKTIDAQREMREIEALKLESQESDQAVLKRLNAFRQRLE